MVSKIRPATKWSTSPKWSSPAIATVASIGRVAVIGVQSRVNRASRVVFSASCPALTARTTKDSTSATGLPCGSAMTMCIAPLSSRVILTRTPAAPVAWIFTPSQLNGSPAPPSPSASSAVCSAASSNAGWIPNAPGSTPSGSATSAYTAPSCRHALRSPWNVSP